MQLPVLTTLLGWSASQQGESSSPYIALSFVLGAVLAVVAHALKAASRAETHSLLPPPPPDTAYEDWLEEQGIRSVMVDPDEGRCVWERTTSV